MDTLAVILLLLGSAITTSLVTGSEFSIFAGDGVLSYPAYVAARFSPLLFLVAAILMYFKPRRGYLVASVAGLLALPWFALTELSGSWNSWISLNYSDFKPSEGSYFLRQAPLKIVATLMVVTTVALSVLRLTSSRRRTWPALAVSALALAAWFVYSVTPYRVPAYDHPANAELRVLHVQKRGLQFQETNMLGFRDGLLYSTRHTRRLFQFRFTTRVTRSAPMPPTALRHVRDFVQSSRSWKMHTAPPKTLRSWNAEGWYVVVDDARLFAFSTEDGTAPPEEVTKLFHELETSPAQEERPFIERDVCLGFCYDPLAALGFGIWQQRVRLLNHNANGA